jgi:hypothetical protein
MGGGTGSRTMRIGASVAGNRLARSPTEAVARNFVLHPASPRFNFLPLIQRTP